MEEQEAAENVSTVSADTDVSAENTNACPACATENREAGEPLPAPEENSAEEVRKDAPKHRERVRKPVTPDMLERAQKDLMKMLDFLGYEDAVVKPSEDSGDISLAVESADAGRIIGRKGQTLECLQLLLNRMIQKDDPEHPRIQIVIDGYSSRHPDSRGHGRNPDAEDASRPEFRNARRDGHRGGARRGKRFGEDGDKESAGDRNSDREDILRQQALDAAKEVRRWGDAKTLPPMNAHDRRIIHITLEKETDLLTESEGDGPKKSITISLKNA